MNAGAVDILVIISLIIFYGLLAGRSLLLSGKGIKVWVIGKSTKSFFETVLENILFPALALWSVFVILVALHISMPAAISNCAVSPDRLRYAGVTLAYIGLAIFVSALISFGKSWRIGIDEDNSNELVTTGMFRFSRNPVFLFMDLYFIGIALIYPNIVLALFAVCAGIGIHLQIVREEKFLLNKFGEKYAEYKKQTRRYI
ncbi:MAG: isoprenylcysteine carboxylmethyltransferase family protein [Rikenellaceae bacterium]|jgi:protein-S-isoprenylcysteine O-methyltransferase Ste14|nr:isoprenylcysteine carboxylmethyltransferase family protein [Rikenellaceae bacterium]